MELHRADHERRLVLADSGVRAQCRGSKCRFYTEEGALVASFSVDATARGIAPGRRLDDRTAI